MGRFVALFFAAAILCISCAKEAEAQYVNTSIVGGEFVRNARFKGVKTFDVAFIGAWDYPDRETLARTAKAEARRLLPGIVYKKQEFGADSVVGDGSHMSIIISVNLAWSPDTSRDYTGAAIETMFDVFKENAKPSPAAGRKGLQDVVRTEADCAVSASRSRLTQTVQQGITRTLEVLADGFFESR